MTGIYEAGKQVKCVSLHMNIYSGCHVKTRRFVVAGASIQTVSPEDNVCSINTTLDETLNIFFCCCKFNI